MVFDKKEDRVLMHPAERCPMCRSGVVLGEAYCRKCGLPLREHDRIPAARLSGFWRRFAAFFIDGAILTIVFIPLAFMEYGWPLLVIGYLIPFAYNVGFNSVSGQTPGKKLLKIRVITLDGSPLTVRKSVIRWIGFQAGVLPFYLGLLWAIWDSQKQAWHDKLAGTCVVKTAAEDQRKRMLLHPEFVQRQQRRWIPVLLISLVMIVPVIGAGLFMADFIDIMGSGEAEEVVTQFMEAGRERDIDTMYELCDGISRAELKWLIADRYFFEGFIEMRRTYWHVSWRRGQSTTAKYEGVAYYESGGDMSIGANLIKEDDQWRITGIIFEP